MMTEPCPSGTYSSDEPLGYAAVLPLVLPGYADDVPWLPGYAAVVPLVLPGYAVDVPWLPGYAAVVPLVAPG